MNEKHGSIAIAVACLFAAAGCHSAASPDDGVSADGGNSPSAIPAIHAVMHWERVVNGKNALREAYFQLIESCKAGGMPTRELSPEEIQKLDTGTVEIWRDRRGAYGRQTSWEFALEDSSPDSHTCLVKLEETVAEGDDDYTDDDWSDVAISKAEQAETEALVKIKGFERLGTAQVRGQPCTRWRKQDYEVCSWSGGLSTGTEDGPADELCVIKDGPMSYLNPLPLESKQGAEGTGCNLQLQSMTISKGLLPEVAQALGAMQKEG